MSFLQFAKAQCAQGLASEAERQLLVQFEQQPSPPSADFGLAVALCNLYLDRLDQAQACLERVLLDHGDSSNLLQLAISWEQRRNEGPLSPLLRRRMQAFLNDLPIALQWLQLLIADLDAPAAIAWGQQLLQQWPEEISVHQALKALAWELQDPALLAQLVWGSDAELHLWQGRNQWLLGDLINAEQQLRCCLSHGDARPDQQLQALHSLIFQLQPGRPEILLTPFGDLFQASPDWAWCFGRALLAAGAWQQGWQLYEQRYYSQDRPQILPPGFPLIGLEQLGLERLVSSKALGGSHVLIYGEQGIGDTLMFASLLPQLQAELKATGGSLQLLLQPRLVPLLQSSFPAINCAASFSADLLKPLDLACSIGSLGQRYRPDAQSFAGRSPHLQLPDSTKQYWRKRLAALGPGLKVGIAWQGGGTLGNRRQRSLQLEQLLPLLKQQGLHWFNLQYGHKPEELLALKQNHGVEILHFDGICTDLLATAGLTAALDLVITVQQTALHIAAGLGVPVWGLLPYRAEWRYGLEGSQMIWYPSVKLFRQQQRGNWQGVIEQVSQQLVKRLEER